MEILNLSIIVILCSSALFVTGQAYAPCIEGPGINCNNYPPPSLSQIKFDKPNYETSDKPIVIIMGAPDAVAHLEIDDSSSNIVFTHDINLAPNGTVKYVLDISAYKPGVYSVIATSPISKLTTSFSIGLTPTGGHMFLNVDKSSYFPGDHVIVLGALNSNTLVQLSLIDPNGIPIESIQTFSDNTGHFSSFNFTIPANAISGMWKIAATRGLEHAQIPLIVNSTSDNDSNIKMNKSTMPSPLKQFRSGIAANDVKCSQDFQLVIKTEDNSPVCVKLQTAQKLVERGWGWAMQAIDSLKPLLPNRITGLENDTGIVTFGNRTYYFETPHYTQDAYVNPVHISFHGVIFTLFPPGFKGGLPTNFGGVAANGCSGSYFWTDAKFPDGTHTLLSIFAHTTMSQQCLTLPAPTYFTTHTDPLAGLTFYDGKLKLLVSVEGTLQQNNSAFSNPIPTNETIYHDFPQPRGYSIINSTQGIIVNNDAEASNLTGFSVKSPTDLPQGYKVKLIKASKEIPMVTIFVSKYPLTENITSADFLWNQQGILITYQQVAPHELEYFNQLFYGPENKIIRINGTLAVISDISKQYNNGYQYDMWGSLLAIQNNDTNIAIDGFLNSDDFIKIATSMLEK